MIAYPEEWIVQGVVVLNTKRISTEEVVHEEM